MMPDGLCHDQRIAITNADATDAAKPTATTCEPATDQHAMRRDPAETVILAIGTILLTITAIVLLWP